MKSDKTIIRKIHMEQLHFITKLLDIKDPNIKILDIINMDTHKEIIAKLDYEAPSCPDCGSLMKKYDFQKPSFYHKTARKIFFLYPDFRHHQ
ncbi:degenerate transposase [Streptococcus pneumoniae]|nr:degenerate transposase [Streptococcus pneumoniae]